MGRVSDGDSLRVLDGEVWLGDEPVARGDVLDMDRVAERTEQARAGLAARLEAFTLDAAEYLRREHALLLDDVGHPQPGRTTFRGREVLVVSAAHDHRADLHALRPYLRDRHPVLIGVDAGADALLDVGLTPDVVVGDLDSAVRRGPALRRRDGRAHGARRPARPMRERLERYGVEPVPFAAAGTAEDAALLLADAGGADVIVLAGSHSDLVEFLDRGRSAMASTFLTRLRVGPRLLEARTAARLHGTRLPPWHLVLLVLAGLLAVAVAVGTTPVGQEWVDSGSRHRRRDLARHRQRNPGLVLMIDFRYHLVSLVAMLLRAGGRHRPRRRPAAGARYAASCQRGDQRRRHGGAAGASSTVSSGSTSSGPTTARHRRPRARRPARRAASVSMLVLPGADPHGRQGAHRRPRGRPVPGWPRR